MLRLLLGISVVASLIHPLAALSSRQFWLADLLSHFQEPAVLASVACAILAMLMKRRRLGFAMSFLAACQFAPTLRYSGANPVPPRLDQPERCRILMVNVLFDNWMYQDVESLIRRERPDVIGLVEVTPAWLVGLRHVRDEYPYRMELPTGASGLALWFREPPVLIDPPAQYVAGRHPVIHARFMFAGKPRDVWLVHPSSPLHRIQWSGGNSELESIAKRVAATGESRIVFGDMNSTDGSAHFRDFLSTSGLRDSRHGFGRQGSWPTDMPYRIAIDHLFLSEDLAAADRRLGYMVGSDHFPLIVDLAPADLSRDSTQVADSANSR